MDEIKLIEKIEEVFKEQDNYLFDKHVPEFVVDGEFLGDFFSQLAVEPRDDKPPVFYYTYSPFDVISGKAPHRAAVFENGAMNLEIDFDKYTSMRTAAMTSVLLRALGTSSVADKKILIFGSGNIAKQSIRFLKAAFKDMKYVSCVNRSGDMSEMNKISQEVDVEVAAADIDSISEFDVIICHTNSESQIISKQHVSKIKPGAIIASFISSTEHGELADEFFNSKEANIICDWENTLTGAKEITRAIASDQLNTEDIIYLKDLLRGGRSIESDKRYTIYRSTGTPMQNLAVLKIVMDSKI